MGVNAPSQKKECGAFQGYGGRIYSGLHTSMIPPSGYPFFTLTWWQESLDSVEGPAVSGLGLGLGLGLGFGVEIACPESR